MYYSPRQKRNKRMAEINVVPYIDVLLVLLIIFMVTIPLMNQSVTVELPSAAVELTDKITSIPIILTIDKNNKLTLNINKDQNKYLSHKEVVELVAANLKYSKSQGKEKNVMVRGDYGVDYQNVLNGIMILKQAGVTNVGLMTKSEFRIK
ncbi:MAG: ExbD/TolR family protein [Legionellales bacterium]|nr:ExbD/TolR family protein [Legionellales bacterium]